MARLFLPSGKILISDFIIFALKLRLFDLAWFDFGDSL
jgi:hypothetical protein